MEVSSAFSSTISSTVMWFDSQVILVACLLFLECSKCFVSIVLPKELSEGLLPRRTGCIAGRWIFQENADSSQQCLAHKHQGFVLPKITKIFRLWFFALHDLPRPTAPLLLFPSHPTLSSNPVSVLRFLLQAPCSLPPSPLPAVSFTTNPCPVP